MQMKISAEVGAEVLWFRIAMNLGARPFDRWLIHWLIRLLHPTRFACVLRGAHLFTRSLTHFRALGKVNDQMAVLTVRFSVLDYGERWNELWTPDSIAQFPS